MAAIIRMALRFFHNKRRPYRAQIIPIGAMVKMSIQTRYVYSSNILFRYAYTVPYDEGNTREQKCHQNDKKILFDGQPPDPLSYYIGGLVVPNLFFDRNIVPRE